MNNINTLVSEYRKSREQYMIRFKTVHDEYMYPWIPKYMGKWALFVKNKETHPIITDTYEEALDATRTLEDEYYVMRITPAPLEDTLPIGTCLITK
jgi:hypothetical protein